MGQSDNKDNKKKRIDWSKFNYKKIIIGVIVAALCILAAYMIERFYFERHGDVEPTVTSIDLNNTEYKGYKLNDGILVFQNELSYVTIHNDNGYIHRITVNYTSNQMATLAVYGCTYEQAPNEAPIITRLLDARGTYANINIDKDVSDVTLLIPNIDGVVSDITIEGIQIDNTYSFHWQRFIFMSAFLLSLAFIFLAKESMTKHPERATFVLIATMGMAMLASIPYNKNCWDDETHFRDAYIMSYALEGKATQWNEAAENFINIKNPESISYEERCNLKDVMDEKGENETTLGEKGSVLDYTNQAGMWPMALSMLVLRKLGLPFSDIFIFSRVLNVLIYAVLMYFAVKITPIGKRLMSIIAMFPTLMYMLASYSGDYLINAFIMLAFAIFLDEMTRPDEVITTKRIVTYCACMVLGVAMKPLYIPLVLVGLMLPKTKFKSKKSHLIYMATICLCCLLIFVPMFIASFGYADPRGGQTSVTGQVKYIFSNPLGFSKMFILAIAKNTIPYLFGPELTVNFNLYGTKGGNLALLMPMALVFLILTDRYKDGIKTISTKARIGILVVITLVMCFVWGSMYLAFTPVGTLAINGVQPRYYVPFMFLLFIILPNFDLKHKIPDRLYNIFAYGFMLLAMGLCNYSFFMLG